ncbi:MAG: hypothetical protein EXQ84_01435 [Rhodospirillaceae bacterium]|nr:hypothetical protein [Rhodospirillaceae bacterium]
MTRIITSIATFLAVGFALFVMPSTGGKAQAQTVAVPQFKVDPYWPKPLPQIKDAEGQLRRWVTGEIGGVCVDSKDRIITTNRGWQNDRLGGLLSWEAIAGMAAPPVVVYDAEGNVTASWGDASFIAPKGGTKVMPEAFHGCFVDYEDNIWVMGVQDGIIQKYSNDGSKMLLQIGTKGICDGKPDQSPNNFFPSCGDSAPFNSSKTLLNDPADVWVDPNPDPVTKERGSIYIADGYGNHRVVVFDSKGKYLRQWGSAGDGPGQFVKTGGGHPHCVAVAKDGMVYACDRGHSRIFEYDKLGTLKRTIGIDPEGGLMARLRTGDIDFSTDPQQTFMYTTDLGNAVVQILNRATGRIVGSVGTGPGRQAGMLVTPHQMVVDSKGNVYVAETITSRRVQKFVKQ